MFSDCILKYQDHAANSFDYKLKRDYVDISLWHLEEMLLEMYFEDRNRGSRNPFALTKAIMQI
jgi:hypothetical protein